MAGHTADNFWDKAALVATYSNRNSDLFRPNTNKILELAEKLIHPKVGLHILDLASGTGNPAIGLAIAFPDSKIHATGMHSSAFGVMRSCQAKHVDSASVSVPAYNQTSSASADLAPAMLQKLQSNTKELKLQNLTCQVADAQDLSFASDCSYDAVTFSLGVHFLPDKAKYALISIICSTQKVHVLQMLPVQSATCWALICRCLAECFRVLKPGGVLIASAVGPIDKTDGVRITKAVHDRSGQASLHAACTGIRQRV